MFYPPKLKKGDKIGVIAPSTPISILEDSQIRKGYRYLERKGYEVIEHPQCRKTHNYTAGTIKDRVKAVHEFVEDEEISCIMSFWGGLNTNQILDCLDYNLIKNNPKIFIGFSDVCSLLQSITNKTGLVTYMGPSVISFSKPDPFKYTWEYFKKVCIDNSKEIEISDSDIFADDLYFLREDDDHRIIQHNRGSRVYNAGKEEGRIVASNLCTFLSLANTKFFPELDNKILFIEEAEDFKLKWIDRFLTQLGQMGVFNKVNALLIGKFASESNVNYEILDNILERITRTVDIPIVYDLNFGHTDPLFTIPNGGFCSLTAQKPDEISLNFVEK